MGNLEIELLKRQAATQAEDAKKAKTQNTLTAMEADASSHSRLMGEDEDLSGLLRKEQDSLVGVESRLQELEQVDIPNLQSDDSFANNEELRGKALEILNREKTELTTRINEIRQNVIDLQAGRDSVRGEGAGLAERNRTIIGKKELPKEKMDEIWRYFEIEAKFLQSKKDYEHSADLQAADIAEIAGFSKDGQETLFDLDKGIYMHRMGEQIFSNPRIRNVFIDRVDAAMRRFIQENQISWKNLTDQEPQVRPINEAAIAKIQGARFQAKYQNNTFTIWDKGNPIPRAAEPPQPEILSQLTENERAVLDAAVQQPYKKREELEQELKLSDYQPDVHQQILDQAGKENAGEAARQLKQKEPAIQVATESLSQQLAEKSQALQNFDAVVGYIKVYEQQKQIFASQTDNLRHYQEGKRRAEAGRVVLQSRRDGLERRPKIFGGGVKDKQADQRLVDEITRQDETIANIQNSIEDAERRLAAATREMAAQVENVKKVAPQALGSNGEPAWNAFQAQNQADLVKRQEEELQHKLVNIGKAKELWKAGKFLNASVEEADFLVPEYGNASRLDALADEFSGQMAEYFNYYNLWPKFPETTWTIKSGELGLVAGGDKSAGRFYGRKIAWEKHWQQLEKLHSATLMGILEQRIRQKLGAKFGPTKVGELHLVL